MDLSRLSGRVAVVTGAGGGLGSAIAEDLVLGGLKVVGVELFNIDNVKVLGSGRVKKVQRVKNVQRYLSYLNLHQVMWYHFLHQGKKLCQNPFSH